MDRAVVKELGFKTRDETLSFLKKLWRQEKTTCPICGNDLELLHAKAKKTNCDWQCKHCNTVYRTMLLLKELNEQM